MFPHRRRAMRFERRTFLGALGSGLLGVRIAGGQTAQGSDTPRIPVRKVKTTPLFKSPEGYPNAIATAPDGLWIGEQRTDTAHLIDWKGKVLKSVRTESKNTSGLAFG